MGWFGFVPRFSVCVVYGETTGPFSEQSKPARTAKVTAPLPVPTAPDGSPGAHSVTLHLWSPHDDGVSYFLKGACICLYRLWFVLVACLVGSSVLS